MNVSILNICPSSGKLETHYRLDDAFCLFLEYLWRTRWQIITKLKSCRFLNVPFIWAILRLIVNKNKPFVFLNTHLELSSLHECLLQLHNNNLAKKKMILISNSSLYCKFKNCTHQRFNINIENINMTLIHQQNKL